MKFLKKHKSSDIITLLFTLFVILLPIINQYSIGAFTFVDLFLGVFLLIWSISNKRIRFSGGFVFYGLFLLITTIFGSLFYDSLSSFGFVLKIVKCFLTIFVFYILGSSFFDCSFGYNVYSKIIVVITVLIYLQYIVFLISGRGSSLLIPGLTLNYMEGLKSDSLIITMTNSAFFRPATFFIEPAHQAEYMIPWLTLSLFMNTKSFSLKKIIWNGVVTLAICLGASVTGIICSIVCWSLYLLLLGFKSLSSLKMIFRLIILIGLALLVINVVISLPSVQDQIQRKLNSLDSLTTASSFTLRLLRGYYCFEQVDIYRKIFGCGFNGFYYYYETYDISTIYDSNLYYVSYMSGLFSALCNIGFVGFTLLFGMFVYKTIKSKRIVCFALLAMLLLLLLGSDLFEAPVYFIVVLFLLSLSVNSEKKEAYSKNANLHYYSCFQ